MLTTSLALIIKQDYNNDSFALNKLSISTINVLIFPTRVAVAAAILNLLCHLLLSIVLFSALLVLGHWSPDDYDVGALIRSFIGEDSSLEKGSIVIPTNGQWIRIWLPCKQ